MLAGMMFSAMEPMVSPAAKAITRTFIMTNFRSLGDKFSIFDFRFFQYAALRKERGFTLIELLAVTALIGLLAGMSILRYAKMGNQTILTNQTRQVYLAAKYARIAAVEKQKSFVLRLDETGRQIVVGPLPQEDAILTGQQELPASQAPSTEESAEPEPEVVKNAYVRPILLNDKLQIEQFLVDGQSIVQSQCVFYPDGTAQACAIQLGDGIRHACVLVTQTGRARMKMEAAQQIQTGRVDLDITE
jgi:prepilin-type N-terminal cleavage/methylation domain-containing protein